MSFPEVTNSRYSMRSLRSSLASSSLGSSMVAKHAEPVTAYTAVPGQRLNLVDVQVRLQWRTVRLIGDP